MSIAVVIPTIEPRHEQLRRAVASVMNQNLPPDDIIVVSDLDHGGAAATRQAGLERVRTDWVAFLDDDDELYPMHLRLLMMHAETTGADMLYPWFDLIRNGAKVDGDVLMQNTRRGSVSPEHAEFSAEALRSSNYIPITVLARTETVRAAGGFPTPVHPEGYRDATMEDYYLWIRMLDNGATIAHLPIRTWAWHWHGANTSGQPSNW